MREDRNVALDTRLRLVRHRVLARPLALALMTLELQFILYGSATVVSGKGYLELMKSGLQIEA